MLSVINIQNGIRISIFFSLVSISYKLEDTNIILRDISYNMIENQGRNCLSIMDITEQLRKYNEKK
jgi:hypothetical protein